MRVISRYLRTLLLMLPGVATALLNTQIALADETTIGLEASSYGFTSPGDAYGPWTIVDGTYVHSAGSGAVNALLSWRADKDIAFPTHGLYGVVGYTENISNSIYGFAQIGLGSGNPFAQATGHVELNFKTGKEQNVVLSVAEDYAGYEGGATLLQTVAGPTVYFPHSIFQARALVQSNSNSPGRVSGLMSYTVLPTRRQTYTLTALFGPQSYQTILPGLPIAQANLNGVTMTLGTSQFVSKDTGILVTGYYSDITEANTGGPLYIARGLTFGVIYRR